MIQLTFLGHSGWLIQKDAYHLLIDPFLESNPAAKNRASDVKADFIIVTHAHGDHLGDAIPIARRTGAIIISNFEITQFCEKHGAKTHGMHIGGSHEFPFGKIKLTPAWHGSSFPDGTYGGTPAGCLITMDGKTIYHAGDTGLFMDMQLIGEMNPIDLALLPIGDNFTMGIPDAVKAVSLLKPKMVIPMHYNTFDIIKADPEDFISKIKQPGVTAQVVNPGQSVQL
ncbi:metal-dependent hydrolase [bacterium]|nr:metal-dependent hydrolase [bacterium]